LDTSVCIYIARKKPLRVRSHFERLAAGDVGMSVVTYMELVYGACKSGQTEANMARLEHLRSLIPVQPLEPDVARHYGVLRAGLEKMGTPIGAYDLIIAAHALSLELTLVTNNVREFRRITGLRLENWLEV
jgi:tRNA(fMet)-specific endonuclease VapC